MPIDTQPAILKILFSPQVLSFLRRRCRELPECRKVPAKSCMFCSWGQQSYPGAMRASIKGDHIKRKTAPFSISWSEWVFSQRPGSGWGCAFFCTVPGRLVSAAYRSRHPDQCPRLTSGRSCCRLMLADKRQYWSHQHWSHPIFDDESRVSLYQSDHRIHRLHLYFRCNDSTKQRKLGHTHYGYRGWLWLHQRLALETSGDGSSSDVCLPTCGGGSDDQESIWVIGLDILGKTQLPIYIIWPCRPRHDTQFHRSAPPWSRTSRQKLFRLIIRRKARFSLYMIVLNRCQCSHWLLFSRTWRRTF